MAECRELEPLFAPYVDNEGTPPERASVEAHLEACAPCRDRVAGERATRDALRARRAELRDPAPAQLRARCAALATPGAGRPRRRVWVPVSIAAALLLAAGAMVVSLTGPVEALAAQLALDHVKCFQLPPDRGAASAARLAQQWSDRQGWTVRFPGSSRPHGMELLGVRRCGSSYGSHAHVLYRWQGEPLSVFVIPSEADPRGADRALRQLGHDAIMWTQEGRTYAVVARGRPDALRQVAGYVRHAAY